MPLRPLIARRIGTSTNNEIVVRLWASISGLIGGSACPELNRRPVNAARPRVAEIPQQSAAEAMKRYPRMGCLFGDELFNSVGVKSDHHFFANHQCRCRAALIFVNQIFDCLGILTDIPFLKFNPFLRKVAFGPMTRRSTRLCKQNYCLCHILVGSANHPQRCSIFSPARFRN